MEEKELKIDKEQIKNQSEGKKKKKFFYNLIDKIKKLSKSQKIILILVIVILILCLALGMGNSEAGQLKISATSSLEKIVEKK